MRKSPLHHTWPGAIPYHTIPHHMNNNAAPCRLQYCSSSSSTRHHNTSMPTNPFPRYNIFQSRCCGCGCVYAHQELAAALLLYDTEYNNQYRYKICNGDLFVSLLFHSPLNRLCDADDEHRVRRKPRVPDYTMPGQLNGKHPPPPPPPDLLQLLALPMQNQQRRFELKDKNSSTARSQSGEAMNLRAGRMIICYRCCVCIISLMPGLLATLYWLLAAGCCCRSLLLLF